MHVSSFPLALLAVTLSSVCALAQVRVHHQMSGTVRPDSAIVLVQVTGPADVRLAYGTSPDPASCLLTPSLRATAATDHVVKFALTGLQPETRYHFFPLVVDPQIPPERQLLGATPAPWNFGTFKTAPQAGTDARVRFVVSADVRERDPFTLFDHMAQHQPDFFLSLGDLPYADGATTLEQYRVFHRQIRAHQSFVDFARRVPFLAIWDDHEVRNDWDGATSAAEVIFGTSAWMQYFPVPDGEQHHYGAHRFGSAVELFVLDTRLYRAANHDVDSPAKSMLGTTQKEWLLQALQRSTATFKVICSSVPMRYGKTGKDSWNGFVHERREILERIAESGVRNVVFVCGDHHLASAQGLREGIPEFWFGPLAQTLGFAGSRLEMDVRWRGYERNYGLITVDPTGPRPVMVIEWYGEGGLLHREQVAATGAHAQIKVTADQPEAEFTMQGPMLHQNGGSEVALGRVPDGYYRFDFRPTGHCDGVPTDFHVMAGEGARVHVATSWRDAEPAAHPVLYENNFEADMLPFEVVDSGTRFGPSSWIVENGVLRQLSDIQDGNPAPSAPEKLGTMAIAGRPEWTDYTLQARMRGDDNDAIGLVVRYRGPDDHYRFSVDPERRYRRLVVRRAGVTSVLAEDFVLLDTERWYDVRISAVGDRIQVVMDGSPVFDVRDTSHPDGRIGLYTWANMQAAFDDVVVRGGDTTQRGLTPLFEDRFASASMFRWTIVDAGTRNGPSRWATWAGHCVQFSGIHDGSDRNSLAKHGTMALAGDVQWTDYVLRAKVCSLDEDSVGLVFRYRGPHDHYRFQWDSRAGHRRLVKVSSGTWTLLHEDSFRQYPLRWCDVAITVRGSRIQVVVNGTTFCDLVDASHVRGMIGLYSWANEGALFDDVVVDPIRPERPVLASIQDDRSSVLYGRVPSGGGLPYLLMLSLEKEPGLPLASFLPGDPRTLMLRPDPLFFASLRSGLPFFAGVVSTGGSFIAPVPIPSVPGLSGLPLHAAGLIFEASGRGVRHVLPTVELLFP